MSLLEMKDVSMLYGGKVPALSHINLSVEKNDWLAVMGPSGSGKTTLMNIIGCMDHATSGIVILDGLDLTNVSDKELTEIRRDKIGIVFQQFHLIPYLTAVENIMAAQYYHSIPDKDEALQALDRVGLKDRAEHLPSQLSGGEQQRVCIARALINYPVLILADEPTGNLDPETAANIVSILKDTCQTGTTVIMSTHNISLLDRFPGRVYRCKDGGLSQLNDKQDACDLDEEAALIEPIIEPAQDE